MSSRVPFNSSLKTKQALPKTHTFAPKGIPNISYTASPQCHIPVNLRQVRLKAISKGHSNRAPAPQDRAHLGSAGDFFFPPKFSDIRLGSVKSRAQGPLGWPWAPRAEDQARPRLTIRHRAASRRVASPDVTEARLRGERCESVGPDGRSTWDGR